jgi:hypothetical protein
MRRCAFLAVALAAALLSGVASGEPNPAPETSITSGPRDPVPSSSAAFVFTSSEVDSKFACALDSQPFKSCTSPQTYSGLPDGLHTFFVFATRDKEKDRTPASWTWAVDTTAPRPAGGQHAAVSYQRLVLTWTPSADTDYVIVLRGSSRKQAARAEVYRGSETSYTETKFANGAYHRYRIVSYDKAGNVSLPVDVAVPASALLLSPAAGSRVHRAPALRWRAVPNARYYNVQLWRGKNKIFSAWPRSAKLKLTRRWTFQHYHFHLRSGTYTWYVWPGFRSLQKGIYGQLVGESTFVFAR